MRKRVLRVTVTVIFLLCLWYLAVATQKTDFTADPRLYPTVDKAGVFHIYDRADLKAFLKYVKNGYSELDAVLESDVDLMTNSYVIEGYDGHFDGQGHTITGVVWSLFVRLRAAGRIENLTVVTDMTPIKEIGAGGLVYYNYGTIHNCHVEGTVTGYHYTGGIAAINMGTIAQCTSSAVVTSLEDGGTFEEDNWMSGYGAGGIAGLSATNQGDLPAAECVIEDCINYGTVTAMTYAGGIAAYLDDRTRKDELTDDVLSHYSLADCVNYGMVMVKNRVDVRTRWQTIPAGICSYIHWGDIFHCANAGTVKFAEDAPEYRETGSAYANRPMAITYLMGTAPSAKNHIVDCVNLKGTIEGSMRRENIMEISEEEWDTWEHTSAEDYEVGYVSNNWEFDLEDAVKVCGLEPLKITEKNISAKRKGYYLCDEFALFVPEFMTIEEEKLVCGSEEDTYALHIQIDPEAWKKAVEEGSAIAGALHGDEECWILRKEADVAAALKETQQSNTPDSWLARSLIEKIYDSLSVYYMDICSVSPPMHVAYNPAYFEGNRIMMERDVTGLTSLTEGDHQLGNVLAVPLQGNPEDGFYAKWILLFTTKKTNVCPSSYFVMRVELGFYPLEGDEMIYKTAAGDTLSGLAERYMYDAEYWPLIGGMNGITNPHKIIAGEELLIPAADTYEKKAERLTPEVIRNAR